MKGQRAGFTLGRSGRHHILALCGMLAIGAAQGGPAWAQAPGQVPGQVAADGFDASKLPRIAGAREIYAGPATTIFSSPQPIGPTADAVAAALAALGWQRFSAPDAASAEAPTMRTLTFKKGPQALTVFITVAPAQNNAISVQYSALPLRVDLPFTADAADIRYAPDSPSLSLVSAESPDALLDFYRRQLAGRGWFLWSEKTDGRQAEGGPSGTLNERGGSAYYISDREPKVTLALVLQKTGDGKVRVEIKPQPVGLLRQMRAAAAASAPAAEAQSVEPGGDVFGLPVPRPRKGAGGTNYATGRDIHAEVLASLDAVLSFYRGALAALGWTEDARGTAIGPNEAVVAYTLPDGTATLKLARQQGLTTVSLVEKLNRPKAQSAPGLGAPGAGMPGLGGMGDMLQQAQQMMREAEQLAPSPKAPPPGAGTAAAALRPLADAATPVPLPETAQGVDFDGETGTLSFSSPSEVKAVADFFRSALTQSGWRAKPGVINNANMVQLDFAKSGKDVSITVMRMGPSTNVTARGSGLVLAGAKAERPAPRQDARAANAPPPSPDDLVAEERGGLPVPKRTTMSEAAKTPFRRELNASVPMELAVVLDFYRRELGKRDWKEEAGGRAVAADAATLRFASPEGPAVLTLGRKGGETTVNLALRNPEAAKSAGVLPPPGKARVMFGNIEPREATITFDKRAIKVPANAGTKAPDGPMLDVAPGKYRYSIKAGGKTETDEVEVRADETWGLMIGPGGVLPLQAY